MKIIFISLLLISSSFSGGYTKDMDKDGKNAVETFVQQVFKIKLQLTETDQKRINFRSAGLFKNPGKFSKIDFYKDVEHIDSAIAWKLECTEGTITISKVDEGLGTGIRIFLMEDRVYFSVFNFASRFTKEINLRAGKVQTLRFYVKSVSKGIATIGDDYLDPRGVDHPQYQGHIWREAKLNIKSNKASQWRMLDY